MRKPFHVLCIAVSATAATHSAWAQQASYPPPAAVRGCEFPVTVVPLGPMGDGGISAQVIDSRTGPFLQLTNRTRLTAHFRVVGYKETGVYVPGRVPAPGAGAGHLVATGDVPYPGPIENAGAESVQLPTGAYQHFRVDVWTLASVPDLVEQIATSQEDPALWGESLLELAERSYWAALTEAAIDELLARIPMSKRELFGQALAFAAANVAEASRERMPAPPYVTRFELAVRRPYCVRIEGVQPDRVYEPGTAVTARATAFDWAQEDVSEHLSWTWTYGGAPAGTGRQVSLSTQSGSVPLIATAVHPENEAYRGTASINVTAAKREETPEGPARGETFSGVYTADLPTSFEFALGVFRRRSGTTPNLTIDDFERRLFARGATLTFFPDGSGLAHASTAEPLQMWSGVGGAATFAWKRLENGNLRVRFVATTRDFSGKGDVRRLQMEYQPRGGHLHPVDAFVMKVTTSSYVQFNVEQAKNPFFSVVRDCPGAFQGQTLHLYRDFPSNDDFAGMVYARTGEAAPQQSRTVADRINRMPHIVPPEGIDRFFEDPVLLCSGNPGVVY